MAGQYSALSLFGECPLPGCRNPVDDPRWPCGECERELAGYIRPARREVTAGQAAAELEERDREVAQAYAAQCAAAAGHAPASPAPGPESKANQLCWCCEQRRRCRPDPGYPGRWICPDCEAVT
jgi:hypothetical protein